MPSVDEGLVGWEFLPFEVLQAAGMISAQLRVGVDVALVVLERHASSTSRLLDDIAQDVIARRLVFSLE